MGYFSYLLGRSVDLNLDRANKGAWVGKGCRACAAAVAISVAAMFFVAMLPPNRLIDPHSSTAWCFFNVVSLGESRYINCKMSGKMNLEGTRKSSETHMLLNSASRRKCGGAETRRPNSLKRHSSLIINKFFA